MEIYCPNIIHNNTINVKKFNIHKTNQCVACVRIYFLCDRMSHIDKDSAKFQFFLFFLS